MRSICKEKILSATSVLGLVILILTLCVSSTLSHWERITGGISLQSKENLLSSSGSSIYYYRYYYVCSVRSGEEDNINEKVKNKTNLIASLTNQEQQRLTCRKEKVVGEKGDEFDKLPNSETYINLISKGGHSQAPGKSNQQQKNTNYCENELLAVLVAAGLVLFLISSSLYQHSLSNCHGANADKIKWNITITDDKNNAPSTNSSSSGPFYRHYYYYDYCNDNDFPITEMPSVFLAGIEVIATIINKNTVTSTIW